MTAKPNQRSSRRTTALIVGVLVLVIVGVTAIGIFASGSTGSTSAAGTSTSQAAGETAQAETTSTPSATATPADPSKTPEPVKRTASPTPQATKTATISEPTAIPIKEELTATVVKMEAVKGTADGTGEIGGPSVRFTIKITNTTGTTFSLTNTVVNAYYGTSASPAVQLRSPGGKDFPKSVKNGASATGVFIFNIPKADRDTVKITVDTSVQNPVIAFEGAAPRS